MLLSPLSLSAEETVKVTVPPLEIRAEPAGQGDRIEALYQE